MWTREILPEFYPGVHGRVRVTTSSSTSAPVVALEPIGGGETQTDSRNVTPAIMERTFVLYYIYFHETFDIS